MHVDASATLKRQWDLLRLLPAWPETITVAALYKAVRVAGHDCSRRTIVRDLHDLSVPFRLVCDESGKTFRWGWPKDASLGIPRLSTSQCVALAVARKHLRLQLPRPVLDDLGPLFDAAEKELETTDYKDWPRRIAVAPPSFALQPPKIDAKVLADVHEALARRRRLTATYDSASAHAVRRVAFDPQGLLIRDAAQYLVALEPGHPKPRQFALQRMSRTVVEAERCRDVHGFSMARYARSLTYNSHGAIRLVAIVDADVARIVRERPLAPRQTWQPLGDSGKVEIHANVEDDLQLKRFLLSFGAEVVVLEPERLRKEMAQELRKAWRAYRG